MKLLFDEVIRNQPEEYQTNVALNGACLDTTIVIVDDDPTGCQTVQDVPVLFSWETELLEEMFSEKVRIFFILANTRSMGEAKAVEIVGHILKNLQAAGSAANRRYLVISRSDSTLRGHYPAEIQAIEDGLSQGKHMHCLVPAFFQGGRFTIGDVHYLKEGYFLLPAHKTPFAKDRVFGFQHSDLKEYIAEKNKEKIKPHQVLSFSISELRTYGPEYVKKQLLSSEAPACIVNALAQSDLDVFAAGAWEALLAGKKILFRTAASFINSFGYIPVKEPLAISDLRSKSGKGGLIVIGSYVEKSTLQLEFLLANTCIQSYELNVSSILKGSDDKLISELAQALQAKIDRGQDAVVYTSRELVSAGDSPGNIEIGKRVSRSMVRLVSELTSEPSFIVAKGGITSHDIACHALRIQKATVTGQALPGVPVLSYGPGDELKYIIFPGNVGHEGSLLELYRKLQH
ncbi:MAG: hypothetical protein K9J30_04510 [Bacteroidales bacterium]|nr:hypothetical protein [Bacteroidales bacterium]